MPYLSYFFWTVKYPIFFFFFNILVTMNLFRLIAGKMGLGGASRKRNKKKNRVSGGKSFFFLWKLWSLYSRGGGGETPPQYSLQLCGSFTLVFCAGKWNIFTTLAVNEKTSFHFPMTGVNIIFALWFLLFFSFQQWN